ncbi:HNH endonuclease [Gloeobacter morelensis]|uniref:HNH endonuclease n=1 Tax=Gloeobacter morelensis MG652769 TaxID=2781736 RepID=A0ABY3PKF2_9CYAN|nr:HNH endonuclease signature motif containing protein [Gloeobacter morelensis]UFP94103.1 HNH endonuclease [Gloeobacter morelensis MG652769]
MSSSRIPEHVRFRIHLQALNRCGYCLSAQKYVFGALEVDHIVPKARGGTDVEDNLWLACRLCNGFKGTQTHGIDPLTARRSKLFNPRSQLWKRHFTWSDDGLRVLGRTVCGRATVVALQLNNLIALLVRNEWIKAGWHPPQD